MKKIIGGKKYDTETAKELGHKDNINGRDIIACNDMNYQESTLYLKKTGEFFLHRNGGANTPYYDEAIEPITEDEAKRWAENAMTVEEYEAIWGEVEE
ncbi:hypothetical protein SELR_pSRC400990 (plasmid) [Selenomonas ruminantium subsp. lactilytica TAM6421]|uniref:Uncharacterized protein n=1 Tax=Selenomonas ruminantium subsp. lactilytica (strain NBRC 103574 / TAM6421) TaxID=927704 RepID=I0GVG3_SELRL|nr:hypothetical protein [Selenomonas ruminantium]BAL84750.1 hypothetical protein SELR_pSRC400990 [Selenomonas ruminantium subsp. lactilytica TAM6421]